MVKKGKFREEQEVAMDVYPMRFTAAHMRIFRRVGGGNASEGARRLAEKEALGFVERRSGPADRRKKR